MGDRSRGTSQTPILTHGQAEELISNQLDGALDDRDQRALATHLASCQPCTRFAAQMGVVSEGLHELPRLPASPAVARQVRERIHQPASLWDRLGRMLFGQMGLAPLAATAALLVAVVGGTLLLNQRGDGTADNPTVAAGTRVANLRTQTPALALDRATSTPIPGRLVATPTPVDTPYAIIRADLSTATATTIEVATLTPVPEVEATETVAPEPVETRVPDDTATAVPATERPTETSEPPATETPTEIPIEPPATETPTEEPEPTATETSVPDDTATTEPEPTTPPDAGPPTIAPVETPVDDPSGEDVVATITGPLDGTDDTEVPIDQITGTDETETPEGGQGGPIEETATEVPIDETTPPDLEPSGGESNAVLDNTSRIAGLPADSGAPAGELAFSPDQTLMVVSDTSGQFLRVADRASGGVVQELGAGKFPIWAPRSGALLFNDLGEGSTVSLYWRPDNSIFTISDGGDGGFSDVPAGWVDSTAYYLRTEESGRLSLRGYDAGSGQSIGEVWSSDSVQLACLRPLRTTAGFVLATTDGWLLLTTDGGEQPLGDNPFAFVGDGTLSPDGGRLAIATDRGLAIVDAGSPGSVMAEIPFVEGAGSGVSWSPDGTLLAVADGSSITIYTPDGTAVGVATSEVGISLAGVQFQDDGIYFVQLSDEPSLRRFRIARVGG